MAQSTTKCGDSLSPRKKVKQATQDYIFRILYDKPKKWSFSKIFAVIVIAITIFVSLFCCIVIAATGDTSPLAYLIPSIFGETAVVSGFYSYKAKAENELKIKMYQSLVNAELQRLDPDFKPIDLLEGESDVL